jgi:hypothetical protein
MPGNANLFAHMPVNIVTIPRMTKHEAIKALGGTPGKAADALGYTSVQAVYMWPDVLPQSTADRVRGAVLRLKEAKRKPQKEAA